MFFHLFIYSAEYNEQRIMKYSIENNAFLLYGVLKCERKCFSWLSKFGNFALEMFFRNIFRGIRTNPESFTLTAITTIPK